MALNAYRHLLRSTAIAFQGDSAILHAARIQARDAFRRNADLKPDDPEAVEAIKHAEEVGKILVENIVQGKKVEGEGDKYRLRIHEKTERGDNDTIKMPNGQKVVIDGKKCSER